MTHHAPDLEETPARQGTTGTGLRWVLRISLTVLVVAFAVIWFAFAHRGGTPGGQTAVNQAPATATTPNSVKEAAATAPPGSVPAQAAGRQEQTTGG